MYYNSITFTSRIRYPFEVDAETFLFYYPVQYRGTHGAGSAERFAMCGLIEAGGSAYSLCGSLAQEGTTDTGLPNYMLSTGQVDRGDDRFADPTNFGVANLAPVTASTTNACWPTTQIDCSESTEEPGTVAIPSSASLCTSVVSIAHALCFVLLMIQI